jgi:hypothetical protein
MTAYGKFRSEPKPTASTTLKSKEERKKVLEEVEQRRREMYRQFYQKQRLASKQ